MEYMTLREADEKSGMSPRRVNYYCTDGRIPGAVKMATIWLIPKDAEKPADKLSINKGCVAICTALIIFSEGMTSTLYWITKSIAALMCGLLFSACVLLLMVFFVVLVRKKLTSFSDILCGQLDAMLSG